MKLQDIIDAWNDQADEYNQWHDLGGDEKVEFALQHIESCGGTIKVKHFVMREQPEKTYIAGYGIGRSRHPDEWTSTGPEPTADDWERWRQKAMKYCRWKNMKDLIFENGKWTWVINA